MEGVMISTGYADGPYVELVRDILKTSTVDGWLYLLLWILAEPEGTAPSLLVLDDFDLGTNRENLKFISHLYKRLNPAKRPAMNIIVVVITQDIDAANALCSLNGGQRVRPLEGFYEKNFVHKTMNFIKLAGQNFHLTNPAWKRAKWTRELLVQVVEYNFTQDELSTIGDFDFIMEDMTPYQAKRAAASKLLDSCAGMTTSPRKNKVTNESSTIHVFELLLLCSACELTC